MVICHNWQFCQLSYRTAGYTLLVLVSRLRGEDCSNERPNSSRVWGVFFILGGNQAFTLHNSVVGEMAMLGQLGRRLYAGVLKKRVVSTKSLLYGLIDARNNIRVRRYWGVFWLTEL